ARGDELLACMHDRDPHLRRGRGDLGVAGCSLVEAWVELGTEEAQVSADLPPNPCRVLADAGGEHERVETGERYGHGSHGRGNAVCEDAERELGRVVTPGLELGDVP